MPNFRVQTMRRNPCQNLHHVRNNCIFTEPTEDWKVEHVLHWWMLRANAESEAEYDRIVEGLSKQLNNGKKELWEAHEQVSAIVNDNNIENVANQNVPPTASLIVEKTQKPSKSQPEVVKPVTDIEVPIVSSTRPARKAVAMKATSTATSTKKPDTIHIDIVGGPYNGASYDLQPKSRSHAWLGRSSSAKFKERGISLPQDLEVSTSHGRFEVKGGKFYYTDVASTNGTRINGEECEPNVPYELTNTSMVILAGQTAMKVTLLRLG